MALDWKRILLGLATGGLSELNKYGGTDRNGVLNGTAVEADQDHINGQDYGQKQANGIRKWWQDVTGQTNTNAQNSAAAAAQEDAQSFNSEEAAAQRAWESQEAQVNRDWQTWMSNTAVQRSAEDYAAAGFNPLLAVGNGASSGSPVMSSGGTASSSAASMQASNVNAIASIGTAAAGIGILIKALRAVAKK